MKKNTNIEFLPFEKMENGSRYDIEEPTIGHFNRFQAKLEKQKKVKKPKHSWYKYVAVAASVTLLFTLFLGSQQSKKGMDLADISPKMEETQDYFTSVIHQELEKVKQEKNSQNEKIINDALAQLQLLEKDYNKQKLALVNNSENKKIIFSMINNYQQRIEVLQNLLDQLNKFNTIKTQYNETNKL